MTKPPAQNPTLPQNPPRLLPAPGRRAAYEAAKLDYLDLDRKKPDYGRLAQRHGVDVAVLMQQATRENWDSLRAAALAQRDLGASGLRLEAVQRVDRAIVGQIEEVARVAGEAYLGLITQIAALPTDDGLEPAGGQEPGSRPEEPDMEEPNERPKTQAFKTRKGPRIKPALLIKVQSLNAATEGFSKFALSLRDLGMVLVPEKTLPESGGATGNGSLPPGTLIQINQMLAGAMPPPQIRNVTPVDVPPPPPPPPAPPAPPAPPPPVQD